MTLARSRGHWSRAECPEAVIPQRYSAYPKS